MWEKPRKIKFDWIAWDKNGDKVTGLKELTIKGINKTVEEITPGIYREIE
jgi:hypothetical protein